MQDSGTMPLITVSVLAVSIGNVQVRQASQSLQVWKDGGTSHWLTSCARGYRSAKECLCVFQMEEDEMDSYQVGRWAKTGTRGKLCLPRNGSQYDTVVVCVCVCRRRTWRD